MTDHDESSQEEIEELYSTIKDIREQMEQQSRKLDRLEKDRISKSVIDMELIELGYDKSERNEIIQKMEQTEKEMLDR